MASTALDKLIQQFGRLPGIGPRSARRIVLALMRNKAATIPPLIHALEDALASIQTCETCGMIDECSPCHICRDTTRESHVLCVVEDVADVWAIERSHMFKGRYHVLGGTLSAMDGRGPSQLNIDSLIARASSEDMKEVILATNATVAGQTTAHYLMERLEHLPLTISRLALGIPMGGELDYLDDGTLGAALKARAAV